METYIDLTQTCLHEVFVRIIYFLLGYSVTFALVRVPILGCLSFVLYGGVMMLYSLSLIQNGYYFEPVIFATVGMLYVWVSYHTNGGIDAQRHKLTDIFRFLWFQGRQARRMKERKAFFEESRSHHESSTGGFLSSLFGGSKQEKQEKAFQSFAQEQEDDLQNEWNKLEEERQHLRDQQRRQEQEHQAWLRKQHAQERRERNQSSSSDGGGMTLQRAYDILGVDESVKDFVLIHKVYRRLAQIYHADQSQGIASASKMRDLNMAHDFLKQKLKK